MIDFSINGFCKFGMIWMLVDIDESELMNNIFSLESGFRVHRNLSFPSKPVQKHPRRQILGCLGNDNPQNYILKFRDFLKLMLLNFSAVSGPMTKKNKICGEKVYVDSSFPWI